MCDRMHFDALRGRVDALEDSVAVYHAKTDEQIKTLFESMKIARNIVYVMCFVTVVAVLALVYGAIGKNGFNAVTRAATSAAQEAR